MQLPGNPRPVMVPCMPTGGTLSSATFGGKGKPIGNAPDPDTKGRRSGSARNGSARGEPAPTSTSRSAPNMPSSSGVADAHDGCVTQGGFSSRDVLEAVTCTKPAKCPTIDEPARYSMRRILTLVGTFLSAIRGFGSRTTGP